MKKIFTIIILLILTTNITLAKTYDFTKESRENYYFDIFFTNEILFEKGVDFKYVGFDIGSNITFPREYKQEFDKHFYPSFSNNEAFGGIYEILEKKLGYDNLKKYFLNQEIGILGQNYHGFDYYNDGNNKPIETNFIDKIKNNGGKYFMYDGYTAITEKIEVNGDKNKKIKIYFHPFATEKFLAFSKMDFNYPTANLPKLTIIDNSILYKDIFINVGDKTFEGKIKYKLDKFFLDRDLYDEKKPEFIYQIVPYYEFEVEIKKGSNILELSYPIKSIGNQFEYNGSIFYENKNEVNFKNRIRNK